ncbi:hypothetical protein K402DRAFT_68131 [Aulographum hederae CBS 113979]|uniref:Clr5 domain-containing protein n=1 Tax=Aulographum hederae CBS 113979 TaxID=1176131 RepID=A0A6G1H1H6_9PEZI|nr:hypothetical protein K402DRAFT_68131 [Aulographum hederae CBS 113979]
MVPDDSTNRSASSLLPTLHECRTPSPTLSAEMKPTRSGVLPPLEPEVVVDAALDLHESDSESESDPEICSNRPNRNVRRTVLNSFRRARASRNLDWDKYKSIIQELYIEQDLSMKQLVEEMREGHKFCATQRQYIRKINSWGLNKNIKDMEMRIMYRKQLQRRSSEGKETSFRVHGREMDSRKLDRFVQRKANSPDLSMLPCSSIGKYCMLPNRLYGFENSGIGSRDTIPHISNVKGFIVLRCVVWFFCTCCSVGKLSFVLYLTWL